MARFHGKVGFGESVETAPGVWTDVIVEHEHYGDVVRASRTLSQGEALQKDLSLGNAISIVANAYSSEHFFNIRYVEWQGQLWTVPNVEVQGPRLLLTVGEVYSGPKGGAPESP